MESQSRRMKQTEDRISELKDEMVIQGKTEELFVKQLNTCEKNMEELPDSIKRPNLRIMGIEEGEEVQAKGIHNIFNKIITENFPNLEKSMLIQVQEPQEHQTDQIKIELTHDILSLKQKVQTLKKEY
jgi:chromosome segregation ATPase